MLTKNWRVYFVLVHAASLVLYAGFALSAFLVGSTYFPESFPGWPHYWVASYLLISPVIGITGYRHSVWKRGYVWLLALAPLIWIVPLWLLTWVATRG